MASSSDSSSGAAAAPARVLTQEEIQDVFEYYANFGRSTVMNYQDSLDSFMLCVSSRGAPRAACARTRARARAPRRRARAAAAGRAGSSAHTQLRLLPYAGPDNTHTSPSPPLAA